MILCTLRHFSAEDSLATARPASRFRDMCVVGLDLAADEAGFPLVAHVPAFALAREEALARTAHAGEARGPESVRETLEALRPSLMDQRTRWRRTWSHPEARGGRHALVAYVDAKRGRAR